MNRVRTLAFVIVTALGGAAYAADAPTTQHHVFRTSTGAQALLSGVAFNAAAASRTVALTTDNNWGFLRVQILFTWADATAISVTPSCSADGTNYASVTTRTCTSGACTVNTMVDSRAVTASQNYELEYDVRGCQKFKLIVAGTESVAGTDVFTLYATGIAGQ
jgi:hypothetical protein